MSSPTGLQDFLTHLVGALDKAGVPYMVVGSLASSIHGEPRSTRDIDVVVRLVRGKVHDLAREFPEEDFYFDEDMARDAITRGSQFNVIDLRSMWKADLILARDAFTKEEFERRVKVRVGDSEIYVATPEDTVIAKMSWSKEAPSSRQLEDAAGVLRTCAGLDLAYIEGWVVRLDLADQWADVRQKAGS